jgi:peptidoglycan/xylan/chitin deacetylase (PgdA/CDA1 family)
LASATHLIDYGPAVSTRILRSRAWIQKLVAKSVGRHLGTSAPFRTVVLCYHSVHPSISFATRPGTFEAHLAYLARHCDVVAFNDVRQQSGQVATRPRVAITFDDGYLDNYEIAVPLLLKHGITATFFLTAGFLGGEPAVAERFRQDWRARPGAVRPMNWGHVRSLCSLGMQVGAHTWSHPVLARLNRSAVKRELTLSKTIIEQAIGRQVVDLAYPYGQPGRSFNRTTMELAEEAGYERAAAVLFREVCATHSQLALPRFVVDQDSAAILGQKIAGWWDVMGRAREMRSGLQRWHVSTP